MPGDFNRALLMGKITVTPVGTPTGARFKLEQVEQWNGASGAREKVRVFDVFVAGRLVPFVVGMREGDVVFLEGTLEPNGVVILGAVMSSVQILRRASEASPDAAA